VANSTRCNRPAKPCEDFPLFPHASGRWCKKVRGKFRYFGKVEGDPKGEAALNLWCDQKDDLLAGREPRQRRDGLTVKQLCDQFCAAKDDLAQSGEITQRSFADYVRTARSVADVLGRNRLVEDLTPDDFRKLRAELSKRLGCVALGNEITRIRVMFKYAADSLWIAHPVRYSPEFKRPAKRILRAHREAKGPMMFEARQLRLILKAAPQPLKAMILLGINCGFGNTDVGKLPLSALDLKTGWLNFPRPKTAIKRRCPLWPETVAAIKESLALRREPKDPAHAGLVFITKYRGPWARETPDNPVTPEFRKLLDDLNLHRPGLGFYALRHTFETIAGASRDQVAVDLIMGHADETMASHYREGIGDDRLQAAVAVVRKWLFRRSSPQLWRAWTRQEVGIITHRRVVG